MGVVVVLDRFFLCVCVFCSFLIFLIFFDDSDVNDDVLNGSIDVDDDDDDHSDDDGDDDYSSKSRFFVVLVVVLEVIRSNES